MLVSVHVLFFSLLSLGGKVSFLKVKGSHFTSKDFSFSSLGRLWKPGQRRQVG